MGFNWIDPKEFSFNCILLMDSWLIRGICECQNEEYRKNLGIAFAANPVVAWYCKEKAPDTSDYVDEVIAAAPTGCTANEINAAECFIIDWCDWAVVYVYPEIMNTNCSYIYGWDKERLYELADFHGKMVLDIGAGTGRLSFAAAEKARHVYASEPVDRLREFMRDKIKCGGIENVTVLDGTCECLPFEDDTFDIVMSGHVVGDDYDKEITELTRVVKSGGWILDCPGEDDRKRESDNELVKRGWEQLYYISKYGGDVYRHRKQIFKDKSSPTDIYSIVRHWWGCVFDKYFEHDSEDVDLLLALIGQPSQSIFEVCCGTGRVLVPLAQAGHNVTGMDADEGMLARIPAKAGGLTNIRYSLANALTTDWGSGYDVVVLGSNTLMNIGHRDDDKAAQQIFIKKAADALKPGGHFFLAYDHYPEPEKVFISESNVVKGYFNGTDDMGVTGQIYKCGGLYNPVTQIAVWNNHIELIMPNGKKHIIADHGYKYVCFREDVHGWLKNAGFIIDEEFGGCDRRPFTGESGWDIIWAKKL